MFKKKYKNIATLDLRSYSTDALKRIKSIQNVACLILPKDAKPEWKDAFSEITVKNCASQIYIKADESVHSVNGSAVLDDNNVADGEKYLVNGAAVIATRGKKPSLYICGAAVALGGAEYLIESLGGSLIKAEPKGEYRIYPNYIKIDAPMLENLPDNFTVISGNSIDFETDVTVNRLKEKHLFCIAGNSIMCRREIYGYVGANSQVGNTVTVKE